MTKHNRTDVLVLTIERGIAVPRIGDTVPVFQGIGRTSGTQLRTGTVVRVSRTILTLREQRSVGRRDIRYRLVNAPRGCEIVGGFAEYVNDYVQVPNVVTHPAR